MTGFEIIEPIFNTFVLGNASLERLASGFRWVEGPVWFGDAGCLLFSDIPNNRIVRWTPPDGLNDSNLSIYREPSNYTNGNTRDLLGRLISCQHGSRCVTRTEHDGTVTTLVDSYQDKRLNSPNDVIVKSDGTIWFTDPHYGIMTDYEGRQAEQELPCYVYRFDPTDGSLDHVIDDFECPNGLAFSPDESKLYVAETGKMFASAAERHIRVLNVDADGKSLSGGQVFHVVEPGCSDGFRLDSDGNIWSSAADGVHCIAPDGRLLGKIMVPELVANICFGGAANNRMFICASTSVYSIYLNRTGA